MDARDEKTAIEEAVARIDEAVRRLNLDDVVVLQREPATRVITPEVVELLRAAGAGDDVVEYARRLSRRPQPKSRSGSAAPAAG
jgi:hypothetical protein